MRKSEKAKTHFKLSIFLLIIFSLNWFISSYLTLVVFKKDFTNFNESDMITSLFSSGGGYELPLMVVVVHSFIFLLFLSYILGAEKISEFIRYKSKTSYCINLLINIFIFATIFSILREAVNLSGIFVFFESKIILEMQIIGYSLFNIFTTFLFYFQTGALLFLFRIFFNSKTAPIYVYLTYFLQYFVISEYFGLWTPVKDATVVSKIVEKSMNIAQTVPIIFRSIFITILLVAACLFLFYKKDLLVDEKK